MNLPDKIAAVTNTYMNGDPAPGSDMEISPVLGFLFGIAVGLQIISFTCGILEWYSPDIHVTGEACAKWPQTRAGYLVPGFKGGCIVGEILSEPVKNPESDYITDIEQRIHANRCLVRKNPHLLSYPNRVFNGMVFGTSTVGYY